MAMFVMIAGLAAFAWGWIILENVKKYEFDNRTDGGVVQYRDYGHAQGMQRKRWFGGVLRQFGLLVAVLAVGFQIFVNI